MSASDLPTTDHRFASCDVTLRDGRVVTLRTAEPDDAAALLSYIRSSLPDNTPYILTHPDEFDMDEPAERAWIQRHRDKPGSLAMLACADAEVIGMLNCTTRPDRQRIAHVAGLGMSLAKPYWGSGLGTAMMEVLIAWAESHPVLGYLELGVYADNKRAVRLYRGQGFVETGTQPRRTRFDDESRDGILMYRRVDGTLSDIAGPDDLCEDLGDGISLRQIQYGDAQRLFDLYKRNLDRLRPWFRWAPTVRSVGDVRGAIAEWIERRDGEGKLTGVIEEDGVMLGLAYLTHHNKSDRKTELGYFLDAAQEGRGLVTRSCRVLIRYAFQTLEVNRIDITADVNNARSQAVAERLGFTRESVLRQWLRFEDGRYADMASYRLLREEWDTEVQS